MIYKVDYRIKDMSKFDPSNSGIPTYVVASDFHSAAKTAKKFETDNLTLIDCSLHLHDGEIAVAAGFKGFKGSLKNDDLVSVEDASA